MNRRLEERIENIREMAAGIIFVGIGLFIFLGVADPPKGRETRA